MCSNAHLVNMLIQTYDHIKLYNIWYNHEVQVMDKILKLNQIKFLFLHFCLSIFIISILI